MFDLKSVLLICYVSNIVLLTEANNELYMCKPNIADVTTHSPIPDLKEYCKDSQKPCLSKCCKRDEILHTKTVKIGNETTKLWPVCTNSSSLGINDNNYTKFNIYDRSIEQNIRKTEKNFLKDFKLVHNRMFENETCGSQWDLVLPPPYLLESGQFASDLTAFGVGWIKKAPEYFCVDLNLVDDADEAQVIFYTANENSQENNTRHSFVGIALLISSTFLVLVLLVYCVLPQLRNLSGMLLMSYVAAECFTQASQAIMTIFASYVNDVVLSIIAQIFYFACLSSFCWLNIMSFDIWWTFRGQRLKRRINRRGEWVKFGWYSLYGWGVPLALTIVAVLIDVNRDQLPNITPPLFDRFLSIEDVVIYYIYIPVGLLTLTNVVLFTMTIYNIWLIKKKLDTFSDNSNSTKKNENRLWLYVKISMLMGVSWLLELCTALFSNDIPDWVYIIFNLYNALIGVVIFIMFVLNKKTLRMLCKRFNYQWSFLEDKKFNPNNSSTTKPSTQEYRRSETSMLNDYESDIEMQDVKLCTNPNH